MSVMFAQYCAAARTVVDAAEADRQVRRLYALARRVSPLGDLLANANASAAGVAYATARIPRALSAARCLLALPGVAEHEETAYALSRLKAAERQLGAPTTRLLHIANAAREAADHAEQADDDLRVVVLRDIEQRCRHLVDAAVVEPVLGRRGWNHRDRTAHDRLRQWAAQWGLGPTGDDVALTPGAAHPQVPAELARQAAARAAARARCTAGIRCTECFRAYGALNVTFLPDAWLCSTCIPAVNARLAARGYAHDTVRPIEGGTPEHGSYTVRLWNAIARGSVSHHCTTPQRAQFLAETERPYNNSGYTISLARPRG